LLLRLELLLTTSSSWLTLTSAAAFFIRYSPTTK
jgi:hypothetical protein